MEAGWPLLQLPGPAQQALVAQLAVGERRSLRLASSDTSKLVDEWTTRLRLTVTQLHGDGAQLQRRFPSVVRLLVLLGASDARSCEPEPEPEPLLRPIIPWPAITAVLFEGGTVRTAARVLAKLPNVEECSFSQVQLHVVPSAWGHTAAAAAAATSAALAATASLEEELSSLTSILPQRLASLAWAGAQQLLCSQQLLGLAQLPLLTRLVVRLPEYSSDSWHTFGRMQTLRSLDVVWGSDYGMESSNSAVADLRGLSLLTHLQWHEAMALQCRHVTGLFDPAPLQPPTSLVQLQLDTLPQCVPLALPQLTSLVLIHQALTSQTLADLAGSCPALRSLEVQQLVLSEACCGLQLASLVHLKVTEVCSSSAGIQFAGVFPQLQALAVRHGRGNTLPEGLAPLHGMSCLALLDVSWEEQTVYRGGLQLRQPDFELLAALPALSTLRLSLQHGNVPHLALLPRVQRVEWVWNWRTFIAASPHYMLQELQANLRAASAPAQLHTVVVCCWPNGFSSMSHVDQVAGMVASLTSWLTRAPALKELQWVTAWAAEGTLPLQELGALAASTTLERVVLDFTAAPTDVQLEPELLGMVRRLRVHGLDVDVLRRHE